MRLRETPRILRDQVCHIADEGLGEICALALSLSVSLSVCLSFSVSLSLSLSLCLSVCLSLQALQARPEPIVDGPAPDRRRQIDRLTTNPLLV